MRRYGARLANRRRVWEQPARQTMQPRLLTDDLSQLETSGAAQNPLVLCEASHLSHARSFCMIGASSAASRQLPAASVKWREHVAPSPRQVLSELDRARRFP